MTTIIILIAIPTTSNQALSILLPPPTTSPLVVVSRNQRLNFTTQLKALRQSQSLCMELIKTRADELAMMNDLVDFKDLIMKILRGLDDSDKGILKCHPRP